MTFKEPIEPSVHIMLQKERLSRSINQCTDLETLKGIAIALLDLHQKKSAIANWATNRALEAEERAMEAERALTKKLKE